MKCKDCEYWGKNQSKIYKDDGEDGHKHCRGIERGDFEDIGCGCDFVPFTGPDFFCAAFERKSK